MTKALAPLKDICASVGATLLLLCVLFGPFVMVSLSRIWASH